MSFYYLVAYDNLESIFKHGILSRENVIKNEMITFSDPSEQNCQIRRASKDLHNFVPLFINPRNAMQYRYLKENRKIVILEIDEKIAENKGSKISIGNASSRSSTIVDYTKENYNNLDFKNIFRESWFGNSVIKSKMQSEILIPEKIPVEYIKSIFTYPGSVRNKIIDNPNIPNSLIKKPTIREKTKIMFDTIYYKKESDYSKLNYLSLNNINPKYKEDEVKEYWEEIEKIL